MKDNTTHNRFIELRASGRSYADIATPLGKLKEEFFNRDLSKLSIDRLIEQILKINTLVIQETDASPIEFGAWEKSTQSDISWMLEHSLKD